MNTFKRLLIMFIVVATLSTFMITSFAALDDAAVDYAVKNIGEFSSVGLSTTAPADGNSKTKYTHNYESGQSITLYYDKGKTAAEVESLISQKYAEYKEKADNGGNSGGSDTKSKLTGLDVSGYNSGDITATQDAAVQGVNSLVNAVDLTPDAAASAKFWGGFRDILTAALGIICTGIIALMTIFTATDVCYIVFPTFRGMMDDKKNSSASGGGNKIPLVSDEAKFAVEKCSISNGKNPLTFYLGKRVFAYIMVAIILFILMTGNIHLIADIAVRAVSGIFSALEGLAGK